MTTETVLSDAPPPATPAVEVKKKRRRVIVPGTCVKCGATHTPEWRKGPDGVRNLCNACGLQYAKMMKQQRSRKGDIEEADPSNIAIMAPKSDSVKHPSESSATIPMNDSVSPNTE